MIWQRQILSMASVVGKPLRACRKCVVMNLTPIDKGFGRDAPRYGMSFVGSVNGRRCDALNRRGKKERL